MSAVLPIDSILPSPVSARSCTVCGECAQTMKKCSNCKEVIYCGGDCQKKDWPRHKPVCFLSVGNEIVEKINENFQSLFHPKEYEEILANGLEEAGFDRSIEQVGEKKTLQNAWIIMQRSRIYELATRRFNALKEQKPAPLDSKFHRHLGDCCNLVVGRYKVGACGEMAMRATELAYRYGPIMLVHAVDKNDVFSHSFVLLFTKYSSRERAGELSVDENKKEILSNYFEVDPDTVLIDPYLKVVCKTGSLSKNFLSYMKIRNLNIFNRGTLFDRDHEMMAELSKIADTMQKGFQEELSGFCYPDDLPGKFYRAKLQQILAALKKRFPTLEWKCDLSKGIRFFAVLPDDKIDLVKESLKVLELGALIEKREKENWVVLDYPSLKRLEFETG